MVKLRHIAGNNLKTLERELEKITHSIVVTGVTKQGMDWYIHFLVQDNLTEDKLEPLTAKLEVAKATKVKTRV